MDKEIEDRLLDDPVDKEIYENPVLLVSCGHTVDEHIAVAVGGKCPCCRVISKEWVPNQLVKSQINQLLTSARTSLVTHEDGQPKLTREQVKAHNARFFSEKNKQVLMAKQATSNLSKK